jgi:rhamnogalacturonyl hydrolase YesR
MKKTWTVSVKDVTAEDNAAAIFASLRAAAWGTYSAMRFAFKASSEGDLDEAQRTAWIRMAYGQVLEALPPESPYRSVLQKFLDENIAEMIKG